MELKRVGLVLIDISGYTQFILSNETSLLHAEDIISQLLETVIDKAEFPLILNKLEGDAALLYAELGSAETEGAKDIFRQVEKFFAAFHFKIEKLSIDRASCPCNACRQIKELKLKAILHKGDVAFKKIRQFDELGGIEVIWVHRLLKNTVPAKEYILTTKAFSEALGNIPGRRWDVHEEEYADLGSVQVKVYYPVE